MKFLSTRDLRNRPGYVRDLAGEEDLVLTANGKPIAILIGLDAEGDVEDFARAIRQARAQRALSRLRRHAVRRGLDRLPAETMTAEIRAVRRRRPRR